MRLAEQRRTPLVALETTVPARCSQHAAGTLCRTTL